MRQPHAAFTEKRFMVECMRHGALALTLGPQRGRDLITRKGFCFRLHWSRVWAGRQTENFSRTRERGIDMSANIFAANAVEETGVVHDEKGLSMRSA